MSHKEAEGSGDQIRKNLTIKLSNQKTQPVWVSLAWLVLSKFCRFVNLKQLVKCDNFSCYSLNICCIWQIKFSAEFSKFSFKGKNKRLCFPESILDAFLMNGSAINNRTRRCSFFQCLPLNSKVVELYWLIYI